MHLACHRSRYAAAIQTCQVRAGPRAGFNDVVLRDFGRTVLADPTRMIKIDRSGKTRLALHAPKLILSWRVKSANIIIIINFIIISIIITIIVIIVIIIIGTIITTIIIIIIICCYYYYYY